MSDFLNEGVHPSAIITDAGVTEPAPLQISKSSTFQELCKEYTFFTHAALVLYGNLPVDPLQQFYAERNISGRPLVVVTNQPMFDNLAPDDQSSFNNMLFAVPNEIWTELATELGSIGIKNATDKSYVATQIQKLPMIDYLALRQHSTVPSKPPMIDIYLVALDGNKYCLHFRPANKPPTDRIKFIRSPARPITKKFADSLFSGTPTLERDK